MKATTVANLSAALRKKSSEVRASCLKLQDRLKERLTQLRVDPAISSRLTTAAATASLVEKLHATEASQIVSALASSVVATTEAAMGECLSKASQLLATIESTNWEIFDAIAKLTDENQIEAQSIRSSITQALQADEHVIPLGPALRESQAKAMRLVQRALGDRSAVVGVETNENGNQESTSTTKPNGARRGMTSDQAIFFIEELRSVQTSEKKLEIDVEWRYSHE
jgi:gas vesicle protein